MFVSIPAVLSSSVSQEPEQTVSDFSLSGFGQDGKQAWEISGSSADVFGDQIEFSNFVGKLYGQENTTVTADTGDFDRVKDRVHLQDNVVIVTDSGARLTTDYLDWDRRAAVVSTDAPVDIKKDNMNLSGIGIRGDTQLQNIDLNKEVTLEIDDSRQKNRIVITCSGPLNINYAENIAVFQRDVFVDDGQSQMYADSMKVFFNISESDEQQAEIGVFAGKSGEIRQIIAEGNVKIMRGDNYSLSQQAVYNTQNKTITLIGKPKLIIYSTEGIDASPGS